MGLSATELAALAPSLLALGQKLVAMFGEGSDGGKKVTSAELKAVGKEMLKVAAKVLVDVVD